MHATAPLHSQPKSEALRQQISVLIDNERQIGRYDFEGGLYVRISASNEIDTEEALEMAETIISLKRQELNWKKRPGFSTGINVDVDEENGEE